MSLLGRTVSRLAPVVLDTLPKVNACRGSFVAFKNITRNFNCLSSLSTVKLTESRIASPCGCGCYGRHLHTKGDKELAEFLSHEIAEEKKDLVSAIPTKLDDFSIKANQSELVLTKKFNDEEVTVTLCVNHTVDAADGAAEPSNEADEMVLKSRPSFEVDIKKGKKVITFTCSFMTPEAVVPEQQGQDVVEEVFGINEVSVYEGEWTEDIYCASGDIIDQTLYDLLMNFLEERGISEQFAEKLSDTCSDYEHSLYVGLLQKLQDFVK